MSNKPRFWNPSFPEKLLFDEEVVVVDLKPHWWHFAKSTGAVTVSMAALIWASTWDESNFLETWGGVVLAAAFAVSVIWLSVRWLKWRSTHFVVTSDRVIYRSGVLIKRGIAIPLERVNNINFHQTILERVIRAGDLQIESAGQDGQQNFSDIKRPAEVQRLIHAQIEENDQRSRNGTSSSSDTASQLEKLEGLRDRGTLTQEEFEREKNKLLGKS
ncbi:MAG: PH domain-containing protein [Actinomycetota bacterium]